MKLSPATRAAYDALGEGLLQRCGGQGVPVIGINGAQGSGKSTLSRYLCEYLLREHRCRAVALSLDDFYLSHAARRQLAATVHPLLRTRGVPGTHDVARGMTTLQALRALGSGQSLALPAFDKATDDLRPESAWPTLTGPVDMVLFEGWCVGLAPQPEAALGMPVNSLEAQEDADGRWRHWVNEQLGGAYARWFRALDALVFLQVPGWDQVAQWRAQQERDTAEQHSGGPRRLLDAPALERFLQHYQRLTGHALASLPARAEVVLQLAEDHTVGAPRWA